MSKQQKTIATLKQKNIEKAKLATLNNILCLINEEVKKVKALNESDNAELLAVNSAKRNAFENVQILSGLFKILEGK